MAPATRNCERAAAPCWWPQVELRSLRALVQDGAPAYVAYRAHRVRSGATPIALAGDEWEA